MHLCHASSVPNDFLQRRSVRSIWLSKSFAHSIAIILRTKLLSHDLNAFWCVRLTSRDVMKTAVRVATSTVHLGHVTPSKIALGHVTMHLGHVVDGASQVKSNRISRRRTALGTYAQTDKLTT